MNRNKNFNSLSLSLRERELLPFLNLEDKNDKLSAAFFWLMG